jgi:hypothetical protein
MFLTGLALPVHAADKSTLDTAVNDAAAYILRTVTNPQVDSVGGEWAIIGLARSGYDVPDSYFENYYRTVEKYVREHGGVLHDVRYTDYSRVILALTAAGFDPRDVAGYDLTAPLEDFEKTIWQGINGPIWALIALDSIQAGTEAIRDLYIDEILRRQTRDGGWSLPGETAEPDITAMALQALSRYVDRPAVKTAVDNTVIVLSGKQDAKGGYESWGATNVESAVQVLVALCELGITIDDERFIKNGNTLVDNILSYQNTNASFGGNQMATEQAFYGLVAAQRAAQNKTRLYDMSDTLFTVTLSVRCDTLLNNISRLKKEKHRLVPSDGIIFPALEVTAQKDDTVFTVLQREMKKAKIHMEFRNTPFYNSAYIMGINNIYEFDAGELSGWMYKVNGDFPGYGSSQYVLKKGDVVEWVYSLDLGRDVAMNGGQP